MAVLEVLQLVHEDVGKARADRLAHPRGVAQQRVGAEQEVTGVERARPREQPVVGREDGGELALALAALTGGTAPGPRRVGVRADQQLLERIDPRDEGRQQRRGVAAEVVHPERQLVHVLEQQRQPVGARDGLHARIQAGCRCLVAQEPGAEGRHGHDGQLLVGMRDGRLEPRAQGVGGRRPGGQGQDLLGRDAVPGQPLEARDQGARAPAAGRAEEDQRATVMGRGLALGGGEAVEWVAHAPKDRRGARPASTLGRPWAPDGRNRRRSARSGPGPRELA